MSDGEYDRSCYFVNVAGTSTQRRPRADGERSRQRILQAAAELSTVEGLNGLSIGRLAEHVGMSKSGLYAHFRSKAARQLAVSNPVVSKAIADLEHTLGVRLLDRSPHGVEPTIFGRALLDRGVIAFDELRQAVKHVDFLSDPTAGEVRIGASITLDTKLM